MTAQVLVVGAGPAGMSAALWLHDLQIPFRWIEASESLGGTLRRVGNPIVNYLGLPTRPGNVLATDFTQGIRERGLEPELRTELRNLEQHHDGWTTHTARDGEIQPTQHVRAVLLCTGTRPRPLGLPAETTHAGHGVEVSVNHNLERYAGQPVLVVGGGDAAVEGALLLARACAHVHVAHRRATFRAQRRFLDALHASPNVTVHAPATVASITTEGDHVCGAQLADGTHLQVRGVFVRIGVIARIPAGLPASLVGQHGFIATQATGRTNAPRLYVAGDVGAPEHQSVAWAVGSAARAIRSLADDLGFTH